MTVGVTVSKDCQKGDALSALLVEKYEPCTNLFEHHFKLQKTNMAAVWKIFAVDFVNIKRVSQIAQQERLF